MTTSPSATAPLANDTRATSPLCSKPVQRWPVCTTPVGSAAGQDFDKVGAVHSECGVPARRVRHLHRRNGRAVVTEILRTGADPGAPSFPPPGRGPPAEVGVRCSASENTPRRPRLARGPAHRPRPETHERSARSQRTARRSRRQRSRPSALLGHQAPRTALLRSFGLNPALYLRQVEDCRPATRQNASGRSRMQGFAPARHSDRLELRSARAALPLPQPWLRKPGARRCLSRPNRKNHRAIPRRRNSRRAATGGCRLAVAQMGPARRHREPHGGCRQHRRRTGLSFGAGRLHIALVTAAAARDQSKSLSRSSASIRPSSNRSS